jgi:hypothetical protein
MNPLLYPASLRGQSAAGEYLPNRPEPKIEKNALAAFGTTEILAGLRARMIFPMGSRI